MKTSLICTVLNEDKTINSFLSSIFSQSKLPDEIIIVDGGSTDNTISVISNFQFPISKKKVPNIKLLFKDGNRSVGRNEAIKKASGDLILISDAGCVLDSNWVKEITAPFSNKSVDVVAGYYKGIAINAFQKSLIPYVLVMEDKVNEHEFLPATRSIALKKSVWERVGKFNEQLSHNEDYAFAKKLKKSSVKIIFQKKAVVNWVPRNNFNQAFVMFYRFAYGDIQANILRPKVALIFVRYALGLIILLAFLYFKLILLIQIFLIAAVLYLLWAVVKNFKYVKDYRAIVYLPSFQLVSDLAVLSGSIAGALKRLYNFQLR